MQKLLKALFLVSVLLAVTLTLPGVLPSEAAGGWTLIGWNNLGMHCMDSDYSIFSILPPYNTFHAQLIDPSRGLVRDPAGYFVTYEAVRDPSGSINTTAVGKTNFWQHVSALYGAAPAPDTGLAGLSMPGAGNAAKPMAYDAQQDGWVAEGVPITPYDDAGHKNTYPLMRLVARDRAGVLLAETRIVLPVSDELSCTLCHASGSGNAAKPAAGWVNEANPERDFRLNILRLHDERQGTNPVFRDALARAGYDSRGLYATAVAGHPILCARCHASNALPGTGIAGVTALTATLHSLHGRVIDPRNGQTLEASTNRASCYSCHPGSTTRCLRGAMGSAVNANGSLAMQCQSCHGPMSAVGSASRQGWLDEPSCQSCHTGTAVTNRGQIRFTSAFENGRPRQPADPLFATNPNVPGPGHSLYRFSYGHGGLACEACHGSTHAEYPAAHANDNLQNLALQGHVGTLSECSTCHGSVPRTTSGGPHGLHPLGQDWVNQHGDAAEHGGAANCRACHGADYRGTVLSYVQADRTVRSEFGTRFFWRGSRVSCYACHNGPSSESASRNQPPQVGNAAASTSAGASVAVSLDAADADGNALELRVVSQPGHGTAGLSGRTATYVPDAGFTGSDTFTFAAWDGSIDSNLGVVTVNVTGGGGGGNPDAPAVTKVSRQANPFVVTLDGSNFHPSLQVTIDGHRWTTFVRRSNRVTLRGGTSLQALFPANAFVPINLRNLDSGGSITVEFNRTTNQWRRVP